MFRLSNSNYKDFLSKKNLINQLQSSISLLDCWYYLETWNFPSALVEFFASTCEIEKLERHFVLM